MISFAAVIWCGLVVLFAWYGHGVGPQRVFKALGYASATVIIPAAIIVGGVFAYSSYKDAQREASYNLRKQQEDESYSLRRQRDQAAEVFAKTDCSKLTAIPPKRDPRTGGTPISKREWCFIQYDRASDVCQAQTDNTISQHAKCIDEYLLNNTSVRIP